MNSITIGVRTPVVIFDCYLCGTSVALERHLYDKRYEDHRNFWCPNGHEQHFTGETARDKAEKRAAELQARLEREETRRRAIIDQRDAANRSNAALRGVITRSKNRAKAGVCPVGSCHRHFRNLENHMATEHPGYVDTDAHA